MAGVYYGSVVVNIRLRFDESLHLTETPEPATTEATSAVPARYQTMRGSVPLILSESAEDVSFVMERVPKRAAIHRNGYRQAGTFDLVFDFRDLPLDPRALRAAAVEIHAGTIPAAEYAEMIRNGEHAKINTRVDNPLAENGLGFGSLRNQTTLQLIGVVDDWSVEHNETASEIHISGRDLRGILIDSPLTSATLQSLDTSQPIDSVVDAIISAHPFGAMMSVRCPINDWPRQHIPAPLAANFIPRHRRGARGVRRGGATSVVGQRSEMSYWDAIVRLSYLCGAIPYFEGQTLWIRPARALYDQQRDGARSPFAGGRPRTDPAFGPFTTRRLLWGNNISKLTMKRKLAGEAKPKVIACIGLDTENTRTAAQPVVQGRWPVATTHATAADGGARARGANTTHVAPSGSASHEDVVFIPVPGVVDAVRLQEIARSLFEEIGRNEINGECETPDLASYGGDNEDADLLRMQPGDTVEFFVDTRQGRTGAPLQNVYTEHSRVPLEELVSSINARINQPNLSRVIAATARGSVLEFQSAFRVSSVSLDWSADRGLHTSFAFHNYFEVRYDVGDHLTGAPGAVSTHAVPSHRPVRPQTAAQRARALIARANAAAAVANRTRRGGT